MVMPDFQHRNSRESAGKISEAHLEKSKGESEKKVACGGGTNDCPFVCLLRLVQGQEGKRKVRLHAARLYWATLQCI